MFVIIVGGATAWFVNRVLLSPIKRLSEAMDEVANGNFEIYLESGNRIKEIKNIYEKFNIMTKELRSTEILQSDFVSSVSHEIKTPITSIEGYTMLLQSEETSDEDKRMFIGKILFNTRRLSELVGNILLLSKIDNQAIEAKKKKFRLDEQIRQSILLLEPKWLKKNNEFDVDLESVTYEGNENLLQHVWNNLIDNAVKFSPEGGLVTIRLKKEEDKYIFLIEDEGPGIPEEYRQKVFNKFYQADDSHKQEGNGLGLALVKKIIDLYQGETKIENLPQKGCRFTVILKNT
ncbi:MAG: HAMP domain-containing histidine kinase [Lachnospiraceae bacterium]|nr:HAMP domain-containing histidine kinase [Lachnospiraceae bacterium]